MDHQGQVCLIGGRSNPFHGFYVVRTGNGESALNTNLETQNSISILRGNLCSKFRVAKPQISKFRRTRLAPDHTDRHNVKKRTNSRFCLVNNKVFEGWKGKRTRRSSVDGSSDSTRHTRGVSIDSRIDIGKSVEMNIHQTGSNNFPDGVEHLACLAGGNLLGNSG